MKMKRITAIAMAACISVCLASPAFAAYQYDIEVSGGLHGSVSGETDKAVDQGYEWSPNNYSVTPDAGYYFKGFHISGQEGVVGRTVINEDTTFVATYGISGEQDLIEYTVRYVEDGTERVLADERTYYGLDQDKPVVAYQEIDGYIPRDAYNLTGTITAGDDNVFTFYYVPINTVITNTTTTTTTTTVTEAAEGTAATGTTAAGTAAGATGGAAAGGAAGATIDEGETPAAGPADIVDLDEGDVPLAGVDGANGGNGDGTGAAGDEETINDDQTPLAGMSTAAKAGIGVIIAAAIVAIIAALAVRARKKKQEDEV